MIRAGINFSRGKKKGPRWFLVESKLLLSKMEAILKICYISFTTLGNMLTALLESALITVSCNFSLHESQYFSICPDKKFQIGLFVREANYVCDVIGRKKRLPFLAHN